MCLYVRILSNGRMIDVMQMLSHEMIFKTIILMISQDVGIHGDLNVGIHPRTYNFLLEDLLRMEFLMNE